VEQIGTLDLVVIAAYLVGIVAVGCYAGLKKRSESGANRYFLAAHSLRWPSIGMALFATNISCLHLVSLAQAGYDSGLLMGNFEWMAGFTLVLLSLFFVPFYIRAKVTTLPDFLEKRYCRECRDWLAVVSVVAAIVFHIAFPLSTGWIVLHGVFGIEKWTCILMLCGLTALYTVLGGLAAVVVTETIQAIVLIAGAVVITVCAYDKMGGWGPMSAFLENSGELTRLSMLRSPEVEKDIPWYAVFLGYPVLGIWYWCADQTIVQRVLGAKDENHARIGPLFCAAIKILPVFIFVLPGLLFYTIVCTGKSDAIAQVSVKTEAASEDPTAAKARTLIVAGPDDAEPREFRLRKGEVLDLTGQFAALEKGKGKVICNLPTKLDDDGRVPKEGMVRLPEGVQAVSSKECYGLMISDLLPTGLFGVMAAALMAALMGNLASAANSISTLFSYDLWKRFRPDTPERRLVRIGRAATFLSFVVGITLVPLLDRYESIFAAINDVIAHIAPPITCVFLLGVFWGKASARSAKWTMWMGSALGAALFALKTLHGWQPETFGWIPPFFYETPFMLMAFYLFVACTVLQLTLSHALPKTAEEDVQRLYWGNPIHALKSAGWSGLGDYRIITAGVLVAMIGLYVMFR
jgi:SSS family transporter